MTRGPGKYDAACTAAREATGTQLCVLIAFGGPLGNGFSVQTSNPALMPFLPDLMRTLADEVEADLERQLAEKFAP